MTNVEKIIVLDYGSQYNQLITRRIREFGVFSELMSHRITAEEVKAMNPKGIILSGGPNSVYDEGAFSIDPKIFELGIPVLGICYGMQLITYNLGGKVEPAKNREYGQATLEVISDDAVLFAGTPKEQTVWMSHGDLVTQVPEGFEKVGTSKDCPIAAIQDTNRNFYGIQFHAEVRHSEYGNELLRHFALDVCQCKGDWSMDNFIEMQVAKIREQVGDKKSPAWSIRRRGLICRRCAFTKSHWRSINLDLRRPRSIT
jgi:GMP synthase (glutamine-hydrolysing)